jgi:hypothetical protein
MKSSNGLALLLDVYILIALLKAGLSDDEEESKALYNVLFNQVQDLNQIYSM